MKKLVPILLAAALIGTMTACGENENTQLQTDYDQLKMDYDSLKADYDELVNANSNSSTEMSDEYVTSEIIDTQSEILSLEIKEFGYYMSGKYLYCCGLIYNPNNSVLCQYPKYRITARDSSDGVLGSYEAIWSYIYPEQTIAFSEMCFKCDEKPSKVEVEALDVDENDLINVNLLDNPNFKSFEIKNSIVRDNKIVGEVFNPNSNDYSNVYVTVLFRDDNNKIVGGDLTILDSVKANSTAPFDISTFSADYQITDNYEIYAQPHD